MKLNLTDENRLTMLRKTTNELVKIGLKESSPSTWKEIERVQSFILDVYEHDNLVVRDHYYLIPQAEKGMYVGLQIKLREGMMSYGWLKETADGKLEPDTDAGESMLIHSHAVVVLMATFAKIMWDK